MSSPPLTSSSPHLRGFAIVIGAAALFGTLGVTSRFAYEAGMEPPAFVAWRGTIGFVGLALFVAWRVRRGDTLLVRWRELPGRARLALLAAALAGTVLNLCMFIAFDRITIALALLGFYTYPALVAVANVTLGRERLDWWRGLALALAIGGMVAVVAAQVDPAAGIRFDVIGIALALGAAVSQTLFVLLARDGYPEVPTEQAMTTVLLMSAGGAVAVALVAGGVGSLLEPLRTPDLPLLLLFTGLAAAAVPSLAFLTGIRLIGGTRAGILMLFEPVVGVALAAWLLAEPLAPIQLVGGLAVLGAAVLLQRSTGPGSAVDERDGARPVVVPGGP